MDDAEGRASARLQRCDMARARGALARQHGQEKRLRGLRPPVAVHREPGRGRRLHARTTT